MNELFEAVSFRFGEDGGSEYKRLWQMSIEEGDG